MKEIALHILDIAENCITAEANRVSISLVEDASGLQTISVTDNGKGMTEQESKRASDPFFTSRSTRKVGLGIPLFRQHAEMAGGSFRIYSVRGRGTSVEGSFQKGHPDRQPLGDMEGCWLLLATANPEIEWELICRNEAGGFTISTSEIRSTLGVETIGGSELKDQLKRMIRNNIESLGIE